MASFVTHLESAIDGTRLEAGRVQTMHNDRPLWVRYDLERVRRATNRNQLRERSSSLWRYRELLPYEREENIVSLGETMTPLLRCHSVGRKLGLENLFIKDESHLPTGSFKARGMAMAITMAKELGIRKVAVPTAGNAGGAAAAYAARAGMECFVFMPVDTPVVNQYEAAMYGAKVTLVNGLISDCGRIVRNGIAEMGWFDLSTLKEPYRIEGKKTMGLELAEQFDWNLPDVILYPTGGGTGLIGMWKAFEELARLGWLQCEKEPRMFACQSDGCCPIVNAFQAGERFSEPFSNAKTCASGLRVPSPVGDFMILDAVRESNGHALAANENRIHEWMSRLAATEGIAICPESAVCFDVLEEAVNKGLISKEETVVIFNTGAAQKYVEVMECELPVINFDESAPFQAFG